MKRPRTESILHRAFWATYAVLYDAIWDSPITTILARLALDSVPDEGTVVDLGCGTGLMSRGRVGKVIGIDTSGAMLRRAAGAGRIDEALRSPGDSTPLADGAASGVLIANLRHLHPQPERVLAEALRVCADGGVVFACWPLDDVDSASLVAIDVQLGRSPMKALQADTLRRAVALSALIARTRRNQDEVLCEMLRAMHGCEVVAEMSVLGCQRLFRLRRTDHRTMAHHVNNVALEPSATP